MSDAAEEKAIATAIPNKIYFKIGEVAQIIGVKPYVLRYWEKEFPEIAPPKVHSKQRLYHQKEIEKILYIRDLLYQRKFTIEGARRLLKDQEGKKRRNTQMDLPLEAPKASPDLLLEVKKKLLELSKLLE